MRATFLSCTLKRSPEQSNTETLAASVIAELEDRGVECEMIRLVDHKIPFGVETDMGEGDEWPEIYEKLVASEILVICSPTWIGQPSAVAKLALERMDAMIGTTDEDGVPVAFNRVAGVINTGTEDGAHHVIMEICGALGDIGYTIPPQSFTYWNLQPSAGEGFATAEQGREWSLDTGKTMAQNLHSVARALQENPIPSPPV
ncbi:MAG: flavodoxin family protein [Solirubrobacterales bacterium]